MGKGEGPSKRFADADDTINLSQDRSNGCKNEDKAQKDKKQRGGEGEGDKRKRREIVNHRSSSYPRSKPTKKSARCS